jgi:opacity protein-like surface antigen
VGATFSFVLPDYTPQDAVGFGFYTNYFFTDNFGAELNFHSASINSHSPAKETSFEYGIAYREVYGKYRPFVRGMGGRGSFTYPLPNSTTTASSQGFNTISAGGGLDYEITRTLNARAEIEYQHWFASGGLPDGLTPAFFTLGIAYHFNPKSAY